MIAPAALVAGLVAGTVVAGLRAAAADRAVAARGRLPGADAPGPASRCPRWFGSALAAAELEVDPEAAWPAACGVALVGAAVLAVRAPALVLVAAACGAAVAPLAGRWRRHRAAAAFAAGLPAAVEAVAARVATGSSLAQALAPAGSGPSPVGGADPAVVGAEGDLVAVAAEADRGAPLQGALDGWAARRPGTGAGLVADALALAGSTGGSQAGALERVGATLREREALGREVAALGSQARASAAVLVATPIGFAVVVAALDQRVAHVLLATPVGWGCLAGGCLLDAAGAWWMARSLRGAR